MCGGLPGNGTDNKMKDNFSHNSSNYSRYRPHYPEVLFDFLKAQVNSFELAWDCATGNGQVAVPLSRIFSTVYATDFSAAQIENASAKPNIYYTVQPAEKTNFAPGIFDLITVGQAVHWFDFDKFYAEVNRTLKPGGRIAIMGYGLLQTNQEAQKVIDNFYHNIIGSYWDPERKYIDENYSGIPFPFKEIPTPAFHYRITWSINHLTAYLKTWSAVKHFIEERGYDPVDEISGVLEQVFGSQGEITFPILLRVGKKA